MNKKYNVTLSRDEQAQLKEILKRLKGGSEKVKRAHILLKADTNGLAWSDKKISEAFGCRDQTVENIRKRLVLKGFDAAINRVARKTPPILKKLDGEQEAKIIALRLGEPPVGFANWSLRLLANKAVALEIVDSISHTTVGNTLKKVV